VVELETTVLLPFEPLASTVIRTIMLRIRRKYVESTYYSSCWVYRWVLSIVAADREPVAMLSQYV
jgi:hypothetical protein